MDNTLENKMCSIKQNGLSIRCLSACVMFALLGVLYGLGSMAVKFFVYSSGLYMIYEIWTIKGEGILKRLLQLVISCYVVVALYGFLNIYSLKGDMVLLWIIGLVSANDTGAFFVGRRFKGKKLIPSISPNKTWSGFIGGMFIGTVFAYYIQFILTFDTPFTLSLSLCFILSLASHAGDLLESAFKRIMDVKDTGTLIPGHGGLLDRLDSFLLVSLVLYIIISF